MPTDPLIGGELHVVILAILLAAVPLAVLLSLLILWRYRQAVLRSMQAAAQPGVTPPPLCDANRPEPAELTTGHPIGTYALPLEILDSRSPLPKTRGPGFRQRSRRARHRAAMVYGVAGALHAAIATTLLFVFNEIEFLPVRTVSVWLLMAWPVVPTLVLVAVGNRYLKLLGPLGFLALAWWLSPIPFVEFATIWAVYLGMPTLFVLAIGNRRLRAVGPLLLVATAVSLGGMLLAFTLGAWLLIETGNPERLEMAGLLALVVLVASGFAARGFLRRVARHYQRKQSSDQLLQLDAWWLLFTLWQCIFLSIPAGLLGMLGLLAFAGYRLVLWIGLRPLQGAATRHPPARLLLLRVFGFRRRSEYLLESLGLQWRYVGSVQLIAGPDLATANLEPHELLDFIGGRLDRTFIKDAGALERQIRAMDHHPDPDGRFRINEFFCHDDTWRSTLQRLVTESDAVLMDLRGFSPANQGCLYELKQLLMLVPLPTIVLCIDATTDAPFLRRVLDSTWRALPASRQPAAGTLRILRTNRQSPAAVRRLFALLDSAAAPSG